MATQVTELELRVLFEISRVIGEALNLSQTLERVLAIISDTLAMKRATVTLRDPDGKLSIHASYGLSPKEMRRGVYSQGEGVTGRIFQTAQPFYVPDVSREPLFLNKTQSRDLDKGQVAFVGVPILLSGEPIGVLNVDRLFGEEVSASEDIRFLTIVAQLIGQFVQLNRQVERREKLLRRQNKLLKDEISNRYNNFFIVGQSPAMRQLQGTLAKVAPAKASVLLLGESGTGKTLVARIIHEMSARADGPFVKINCAALPENLLESELFGHAKGAFTGATEEKPGRFEQADGGTIFLDEIAEMPISLQAKLLRFLQDKEFERLGSPKTHKVDVRIIAATNQNLPALVERKEFRQDLYYRLNVFPLHLPPLRERVEDIPLLINHFLDKNSVEYSRRLTIDRSAEKVLLAYEWPGNVRELENIIERLSIMVEQEVIGRDDLPGFLMSAKAPPAGAEDEENNGSKLDELEKGELLDALERNRWVQSRAASDLGITLRKLGYRLKKYGLEEKVKAERHKLVHG
ncbi:MAG: sigma 54-interacting transcriptional regulator [Desulfarculaceae bacterium]|nr:sigma 54-interacting transcriptional regulator [Desulfarculaceae bacterium]MCF8071137.1 sigma 54-interacting transcriptional regulator [Desulfarculaceae bacterium]MCF8101260.1 sigma 54-interacting transcriptional regulator [Desulfarculaceae bacterium]MCF8115191.1 sigma 54-interacting transcriptional regulator [Desulfarculaceae bacterium]